MFTKPSHRYVSVKFAPIGRPQTFLLDDVMAGAPPPAGDRVVVENDGGAPLG
jgi:hypothetical protein